MERSLQRGLAMFSILGVVAPIFALILVGFLAGKRNILGPNAAGELNRFVVYLALPALLFDVMARTSFEEIYQPAFVAAFTLGCGLVFALTVVIRLRQHRHLADASIDGLNAGYANTGYMGFPLAMIAFGPSSLAPTSIAAILTVCFLFGIAIILIEVGLQTERHAGRMVLKVVRSLARNPLLIAPAAGAAFAATGIAMPAGAETFLKLLGGAASPCALVSLGLFLATTRTEATGTGTGLGMLVGFKLILQPTITWLCGRYLFGLQPPLLHMAVLLAALPTGTGPYMLAEFYRRGAAPTARAILFSTVGSLVTVSAYLALIR
ncbi:putative permease [Kaistia dalseonensis]|uniref:Permease n=2 Tax=Kaistia dalseonensis TaxID=410840 RepID=A0ABU0H144_9HYPH|nr:putative permease [Kaistia dalseonensis]